MGTPRFAAIILEFLVKYHEVIAIYCQPPSIANRGKKITLSATEQKAIELGLENLIKSPTTLKNSQVANDIKDLNPDAIVVAAYGLLLPPTILEIPKYGCLNIHASLLPKWRGAAPIQRAIMAGDDKTGITIMKMTDGLDEGCMMLKEETLILNKTTEELTKELADIGATAIRKVLNDVESFPLMPQDDNLASYAKKISKQELKIDFGEDSKEVKLKVQALKPYFMFGDKRIKIIGAREHNNFFTTATTKNGEVLSNDDKLLVKCGRGVVELLALQLEGRKAMQSAEFLRGFKIEVGSILF
jgi:methionyl-tRNA formyltransferase